MRTFANWLGGAAMALGLAVFGYQNPALGTVLLFGGAALWVVAQRKTIPFIERAFANKSTRLAMDADSAKRVRIRNQFDDLSLAEKEAIRHIKANGHILPHQVAQHLASKGFADSARVVDGIRSKTPFLLGSFSGEFSVNPQLKELLDDLLNPPLFSPLFRVLVLLMIAGIIVGCGYLFRHYVYPTASQSNSSSPVAPVSNPTNQVQPSITQNAPTESNHVHVTKKPKIPTRTLGLASKTSPSGTTPPASDASCANKATVVMVNSDSNIFEGYCNLQVDSTHSLNNRYSVGHIDPGSPASIAAFRGLLLAHVESTEKLETDFRYKRNELKDEWSGVPDTERDYWLGVFDGVRDKVVSASNANKRKKIIDKIVSREAEPKPKQP